MIRSQPVDPRDQDPTRFPWGAAVAFVLVLAALLFGGTHIIEAEWGLGPVLTYQFFAALAWLVAVCCWLAFRGCGKRKG